MKKHENYNKKRNTRAGLGAGVLAVGMLLSAAPAAHASESKNVESAVTANTNNRGHGNEALNEAIATQERMISRDIAAQKPVHFKDTVAYYHGGGKQHFYIENPLAVSVQIGNSPKKIQLIGYIEPKGSGTGPDVVMFEDNYKTTSEFYNPADPLNMQAENAVIFPSKSGAAFDTTNPIDPANGQEYTNQAYEPSLIGYQYVAKK